MTDYLLIQALNGLVIGVIYAVIAAGLTVIFSILKIVNFAHGEVYMMGGYFGYFAISLAGIPPLPAVLVAMALSFALSQLGVPYVWGGESTHGFDCSGLVQLAYRTAGVSLPRTAEEQFDAGPRLPAGAPLEPGDLVFFGQSDKGVTHVGIVVRSGEMVDAPHEGADVRTESFPTTVGAAWGEDRYLGATRPAS